MEIPANLSSQDLSQLAKLFANAAAVEGAREDLQKQGRELVRVAKLLAHANSVPSDLPRISLAKIDAVLSESGLQIEERLFVKSQLVRAGVIV